MTRSGLQGFDRSLSKEDKVVVVFSITANSRTLVEGTWLKALRYQ